MRAVRYVQLPAGPLAIVAAHPDDEVIGACTLLLRRGADCRIIHLTDGAPRDMRDAHRAGFASRETYARARRAELFAALAEAGLPPHLCTEVGLVDQEAVFALPELVRTLHTFFDRVHASAIVTHPYEGGHPDHDSAAFACRAVVELQRRERGQTPVLFEMTSYHAGARGISTGTFLPAASTVHTVPLGVDERARKRAVLSCFTTQQAVLSPFGVACERFREAPRYRFGEVPHDGPLYYERFVRGFDGREWRRLAGGAAATLHLEPAGCH